MEKIKNKITIDARGMHYRALNSEVKSLLNKDNAGSAENGGTLLALKNINGQRYIGDGIKGRGSIKVYGTPGNDLAAFMDGPQIEVFANGQDGIANTMNSGRIIIHGDAGDIMGYSMRGGQIYVKGSVGWRCGIHMKSYLDKYPLIVIGGSAGNFLGEYMAGGVIIVLGLDGSISHLRDKSMAANMMAGRSIVGDFVGTGMHGGVIYIRGDIEEYKMGREVKKMSADENDCEILKKYIKNYCKYFKKDYCEIISQNFKDFIKLIPHSHRPYGKLYAY